MTLALVQPRQGLARGLLPTSRAARFAIAAAFAVFAVPALAQSTTTTSTTNEYYVVQDTATRKCTIVDKKPTTTAMVQVGPMAFKSRTEAESGMKTIKVCETQ